MLVHGELYVPLLFVEWPTHWLNPPCCSTPTPGPTAAERSYCTLPLPRRLEAAPPHPMPGPPPLGETLLLPHRSLPPPPKQSIPRTGRGRHPQLTPKINQPHPINGEPQRIQTTPNPPMSPPNLPLFSRLPPRSSGQTQPQTNVGDLPTPSSPLPIQTLTLVIVTIT